MRPEDSEIPEDWRNIAEKDLRRVQLLLDAGDPEGGGFHLQQAIEKYLKAFLLSKGWRLRRTHDLEALLNEALGYDTSLDEFRSLCQRVTQFYTVDRYPPSTMAAGIDEEDVRQALPETKRLIGRLRA